MELDKYQKEAYLTKEDRVLVVAPPGSGKTTVMLERLNFLLEKGIDSEKILVLTFSKASSIEMKERFTGYKGSLPFFGTIHGLCFKMLRQLNSSINLIYGKNEYIIRNKIQKKLKIDSSEIDRVLNDISVFKIKDFLGETDELDFKHNEDNFKKAYNLYESERKKLGLLDFDDLQIEMLKMLLNKDFKASFQNIYTHILVDEFQDLDSIQLKIIREMADGRSLFGVGDEDQCIYAFRGSDPKGMLDFEEVFDGKKLYLKYNYRSTENIVKYAKEVIKYNKFRNDKDLLARRKGDTKIYKIFPENQELMLLDIKKELLKEEFESYAILYRTNSEGLRIKEFLSKENISFNSKDNYSFFKSFIARDILSYFEYAYFNDPKALLKVINKPYRFISRYDMSKISQGADIEDVLLNPTKNNYAIIKSREFLKNLDKIKGMETNRAISFIETTLEYKRYLKEYAKRSFRDFSELEEELFELKEIVSYYSNPLDLIKRSKEEDEKNDSNITLSTIHGVKGLEYDKVFVINVVEGFIPHSASFDNIEEERRIFYVAITRAKNELNIYSPKTIHGKEKKRSRFLI